MTRRPLLVLLLAGCLALPLGQAHAAPVDPSGNAWTEISHPRPGGADTYLWDVVAVDVNDIWTVGHTFDVVGGAFEFRTFGQHCVDGVCTRANLPNREGAPATNFLFGVDAVSADELWAVGYSRDPGESSIGLAIRYTSGSWQIVDSPSPPGAFGTYLEAVAARTSASALAVGSYQDGSLTERPFAMGWNGARWTVLPFPTGPGCTTRGRLTDAIYLGGSYYVTGVCRTPGGTEDGFVAALSQGRWRSVLAPGDRVLAPGDTLVSITVADTAKLVVVGSNPSAGTGVARVFTGSSWQTLPVPQAGQYTQLSGVAAVSRVSMYAVGTTSEGLGPQRLSLNWVGRGGTFTVVPAGGPTELAAVTVDPFGRYFAVGHNNSDSVIQEITQ